jgi:hypothetical protein
MIVLAAFLRETYRAEEALFVSFPGFGVAGRHGTSVPETETLV